MKAKREFKEKYTLLTTKNIQHELRKKILIMCILPAALHGSKTWTTNKMMRNIWNYCICGAVEDEPELCVLMS